MNVKYEKKPEMTFIGFLYARGRLENAGSV